MHPRLEEVPHKLKIFDMGFSRRQSAAFLAVLLVGGLAFCSPIIAWIIGKIGVGLPRPLMFAVIGVGGLYVALIVLIGEIELGSMVAFLVTATFVANVPLTASAPAYPGSLGPQLFLFEMPLLVLFALQLLRGEYSRESFTWIEYVFGAFVLWTVLSALLGDVSHRDTALFFALYLFVILLAFSVTRRSVRRGLLDLRGVLWVFLIAIYGHVLFALAQFINQEPFGLTVLGEIDRSYSYTAVDLGFLGTHKIGVFLSGFTGGNSPLSVLLILSIPIALVLWKERPVGQRVIGYLSVVLMVGVLRATAKDAARGALLIAIVLFSLIWLWVHYERKSDADWIQTLIHQGKWYGTTVALSLVALMYPSTTTGRSGKLNLGGGDGDNSSTNESINNSTTPSANNGSSSGSSIGGGGDPATISIPYFDLGSLGIRLQQYVAAFFIAADHPLFGVGGANYPYIAKQYGLPAKLRGHWFPMHNMYLATLAETGIPGFLLFMATLAMIFREGIRRVLADRSGDLLAAGLFAGMLGYAAVMFWEVNVRITLLLPFWLLMGALVADNESRLGKPNGLLSTVRSVIH